MKCNLNMKQEATRMYIQGLINQQAYAEGSEWLQSFYHVPHKFHKYCSDLLLKSKKEKIKWWISFATQLKSIHDISPS